MEISVSRATLSAVCVLALVCSAVDAMNYLAFPRMGRSNYLAFPRMGRSQSKAETASDSCCGLGLKSELAIGQDGKVEELVPFCPSDSCCEGLTESMNAKSSGVFYSFCVPATPSQNAHTSEVVGALKRLLHRK